MGLGDWIMATAQIRALNEQTGKKVVVVDRLGRPRWSEAFENNPRLGPRGAPIRDQVRLLNAGGARPYIQAKTDARWHWRVWDIAPGEIYLSVPERMFGEQARGAVIVEPNTKAPDSNKAWPFDRWQAVVRALPVEWVQVGAPVSRRLEGVRFIETTTRQAFGVLAAARLFVGTEGALHHAAAALGRPAVVLWSEFIAPQYTGYTSQRNIRKATDVCGSRLPCSGCRASMAAITVEEVAQAITEEVSR